MRTYGRTRSRTLSRRGERRILEILPRIATPREPFDPRDLSPGAAEVWLEIGFGAGEHLCALAAGRPDVLFLGAEPFVNGIAAALARVETLALANVRIHAGDGRDLLALLPPGCLRRLYILFPDPWPKTRHHKRRLVTRAFIAEAARVLRPGAQLTFATDWMEYADQTLRRFIASPDFLWTAETADAWRCAPAGHFHTRYEQKRLGDGPPVWLEFERR